MTTNPNLLLAITQGDSTSTVSLLKKEPISLYLNYILFSLNTENAKILQTVLKHCLLETNNPWNPNSNLSEVSILLENKLREKIKLDKIMIWACTEGYIEIVKLLDLCWEIKTNGTQKYEIQLPFLFATIKNNHPQILEALLFFGADVNSVNNDGNTLLLEACIKNNTEIVKILLAYGADVNIRNGKQKIAIIVASSTGNLDIVKMLLEHGAFHGILNGRALFAACECGSVEVVEILLKLTSVVEREDIKQKSLRIAACEGHLEVVKFLIKQNTEINSDYHPLIIASDMGNEDVVEELIKSGAEVDRIQMRGSEIYTALRVAIQEDHVAAAKILINNGARWDIFGYSLLPEAGERTSKILLELGADVNAIGMLLLSPIATACQDGNIRMVNELIKWGANINDSIRHGSDSPISYAARYGHFEVVKALVNHGAILDIEHGCKISIICWKQHYEVASFLIRSGADVRNFLYLIEHLV